MKQAKPKKKPRKVWEFGEWFEAQHGKRPGSGLAPDRELEQDVIRGEYSQRLLRDRQLWDERRTSALYAWQIPDRNKPR